MRTPSRHRPAFTLVELLVVIGVVALLISILLPALARARQQANAIKCLSNLRQMAVAAHVYVVNNQGRYPPAYWGGDGWDYSYPAPGVVTPGLLWGGGGSKLPVQQCPSFEGRSAGFAADPHTGYNYNTSHIGHGQFETDPRPAKASRVRRPSETVLFGDGQYAAGANKYMRSPLPHPGDALSPGRWAGTQGFRHLGRTNAAFCDGHAESIATRHVSTTPADAPLVAPGTGFLSADNAAYDLE